MSSPCIDCIVNPMCKKSCNPYELYILKFIKFYASFLVTPSYNSGKYIREQNTGMLRLSGKDMGKKRSCMVQIWFKDWIIYKMERITYGSIKTDEHRVIVYNSEWKNKGKHNDT